MNNTIDINKIHPDLEPVGSAPSLFSFYGFGTGLYGNRDYSPESKSSIKTLYLTALYLPIIPLRAYRVIKEGRQYYFLGRTPVSKLARNGALAAILTGALGLSGLGLTSHFTSDKFKNGKVFEQAEAASTKGNYAEAMRLYKDLYSTSSHYKRQVRINIANIMSVGTFSNTNDSEFADTLEAYNSFGVSPLTEMPEEVYQLAISRIKTNDKSDGPTNIGAHKLLHAASNLNAEGEDLSKMDQELIGIINASDPTNLEAAVELSEKYYVEDNLAKVKTLLSPVKDKLGDSEGARILGQIYISEGNNKAAYPLLSDYTSARLEILKVTETEFTELQTQLWEGEFNILNNGLAPQSFYDDYESKTEVEQQLLVDEYINKKVEKDESYQASLTAYRKAAAIVPVVMDFGILQLRSAETMTSETDRNEELKAAEKTFLSIKNIVGDTDDYKIYLGQVYFWLGKQVEGQTLFDEILEKNGRDTNSLISIAGTLRALGKVGPAKELAQEGYDSAKTDELRYTAANFMQLMGDTTEEKIMWLKRSDPKAPYVQASLLDNQGHLAAQKGNSVAAANYYKQAIRHSESLADEASNYNNTALIYFSLHRVNGDKKAYQKGVELMSKAVELRPDESILLSNAASTLVVSSLYNSTEDDIDYQAIQNQPSLSTLGYLYSSETEKEALRQKIGSDKDFKKAVEYLERSTLLSPNSLSNYSELYSLYYFLSNEDAIASLADKMVANKVDISAAKKQFIKYINGTESAEELERLKTREIFYKELLAKNTLNTATSGVVFDSLAENLLSQVGYDELEAAQDAVKYAEQAVLKLKSSETKTTLTNALLTLASVETSKSDANYKALRDKAGKNLRDSTLVILALGQDNETAKNFISNKHMKRAINMEIAEAKVFSQNPTPENWALLKAAESNVADQFSTTIKASDLRQSMQRIAEASMPLSGEVIASRYWLNKVTGKPTISAAELADLESQGITLPAQLFE